MANRCPPANPWNSTSSSSAPGRPGSPPRSGSSSCRPSSASCVVEKGSEVGAHILSGAVIDPIGLDRLLPGWRDEDTPIKTAVTDDRFYWLGHIGGAAAAELPDAAADVEPRQLHRARSAMSAAGSPPRPRRSASKSIRASPRPKCCTDETARCAGVATGDMGIGKDGKPRSRLHAAAWSCARKYTLFAEGARGSLSKTADRANTGLTEGREPQKFGIGLKELWQVAPGQAPARPGAAHVRLAARQRNRRRLVPLSLRRQPGLGRLRRPSQLRESVSVAVRGIPALQDASAHPRHLRGRQARCPMARAPSPRAAISRCRS